MKTHLSQKFALVPPLLRQVIGGLIGALVALVVYGVYEVASPSILALLPSSSIPAAYSEDRREIRQQQIADLAKEIFATEDLGHE